MLLTDEDVGDAIFAQLRASGITNNLEATQKELEQGSDALMTKLRSATSRALRARAKHDQTLVLDDLVKATLRALRRKHLRRYEARPQFKPGSTDARL